MPVTIIVTIINQTQSIYMQGNCFFKTECQRTSHTIAGHASGCWWLCGWVSNHSRVLHPQTWRLRRRQGWGTEQHRSRPPKEQCRAGHGSVLSQQIPVPWRSKRRKPKPEVQLLPVKSEDKTKKLKMCNDFLLYKQGWKDSSTKL